MAKVSIDYDDSQLRNGIRQFDRRLNRAVGLTVDRRAMGTIGWLRTNARWTDNTGAARTGLFAVPNHLRTTHEILMAYSVTYGIWLEVANSGKYAIITPGMRIIGGMLMADLQYLINRMESMK